MVHLDMTIIELTVLVLINMFLSMLQMTLMVVHLAVLRDISEHDEIHVGYCITVLWTNADDLHTAA